MHNFSKHNYDNDVFKSLLEGMKDDIIIKTASKQETKSPISGMDIFSSTTENNLYGIQKEEFEAITNELQFAADKAKIALTQNDFQVFASRAYKDNLTGKKLERAAKLYCNNINRAIADPQSTTKLSSDVLYDMVSQHKVISASCASDGINETKSSGKFMGSIRNPNTIWDTEALSRYASVKHADEMIKEAKTKQEETRQANKQVEWKELSEALSSPNMIGKGIIKAADTTAPEQNSNRKVASNEMSIFDNDRDFSQIPEKGSAEMIKQAAQERAEKSKNAKSEWNGVKPCKKMSDSLENLFNNLQ